ncbi:MAG: hypothetical protein ACRCYP_07290 [Alphaproteobacteria bacterium]
MKHSIYAAAGFICLNLGHVTDGRAVSIVQCYTESCLPGSRIYSECDKHFPKSYEKCLAYRQKTEGRTPPFIPEKSKGQTPPLIPEPTYTEQ